MHLLQIMFAIKLTILAKNEKLILGKISFKIKISDIFSNISILVREGIHFITKKEINSINHLKKIIFLVWK